MASRKLHRFLFVWFTGLLPGLLPGQDVGPSYALFFAGNEYDHYRNLSQPIANAEAIAEELETHYGFQTEIIRNPTLVDIEQALKKYDAEFSNESRDPAGQLLIYFTGHGMVENHNGFFLPKDGEPGSLYRTALGYNYWREFINNTPCRHILVVLDACFSGTFDPKWYSRSGITGRRPGEAGPQARLLANNRRYQSRIFFTSAEENEVPDRSDFAREFLTALRSRTEAHQDGILTSSELWLPIGDHLNKTHQGHFGDHEGDANFLFVLPGREAAKEEEVVVPAPSVSELYYLQHVLKDHDHEVQCVVFSDQGQSLASVGKDDTIRIWDPLEGVVRARFPNYGWATAAGSISALVVACWRKQPTRGCTCTKPSPARNNGS